MHQSAKVTATVLVPQKSGRWQYPKVILSFKMVMVMWTDGNLFFLMHAPYHQCSIYILYSPTTSISKIFTNNMVITILDYIARCLEIASHFCRSDVMTCLIYDAQEPILPVLPQKCFDEWESLFNWIIIGRIQRQKDKLVFWKAQVSIHPSMLKKKIGIWASSSTSCLISSKWWMQQLFRIRTLQGPG